MMPRITHQNNSHPDDDNEWNDSRVHRLGTNVGPNAAHSFGKEKCNDGRKSSSILLQSPTLKLDRKQSQISVDLERVVSSNNCCLLHHASVGHCTGSCSPSLPSNEGHLTRSNITAMSSSKAPSKILPICQELHQDLDQDRNGNVSQLAGQMPDPDHELLSLLKVRLYHCTNYNKIPRSQ